MEVALNRWWWRPSPGVYEFRFATLILGNRSVGLYIVLDEAQSQQIWDMTETKTCYVNALDEELYRIDAGLWDYAQDVLGLVPSSQEEAHYLFQQATWPE